MRPIAALLPLLLAGCAHPTAPVEAAGSAPAHPAASATVLLQNSNGEQVGRGVLSATPRGVLIGVQWADSPARLPPGIHGIHIHSRGDCSGAKFEGAGPHARSPGDRAHGLVNPDGPEAGDLPNLFVPQDGRYYMQAFTGFARLEQLLDADGAALVVHAAADDHVSQPAGSSGDRIACGVLKRYPH